MINRIKLPYILMCLFFGNLLNADTSLPKKHLPVPVTVGIYVADLDSIDTINQSFVARVFYQLRWNDPRLAYHGTGPIKKDLDDIWNPQLQILNQESVQQTNEHLASIMPNGDVTYLAGIWGAFSQPMKLKDFPFDQQSFSFHLVSSIYTPEQVKFIENQSGKSGIAENLSVTDWKIENWDVNTEPFNLKGIVERSEITFSCEGKRLVSYFVIKMILPLILIVVMSWVVFWMDPMSVTTNVRIAMGSILTLIAYRFSIDAILPRLPYLTSLDYFILASTILVFLSLLQCVISSRIAKKDKVKQANTLNIVCRFIFPLVFIWVILETLVFRSYL